MKLSLILAADLNNGIGINNGLLCHLPADLKFFKQKTTGHIVLMGRKTYDSIGRPLPNRVNLVLTRSEGIRIEGCEVVHSLKDAIELGKSRGESELFVIGGDQVYRQALPLADGIYLTRIFHSFEADAYFEGINPEYWKLIQSEEHQADEKNPHPYAFEYYERIR